jgi:dolichol-phosphate mannosyltransferase
MINANVRSPGYLLPAYGAWFVGRIVAHTRYLVRFGLVGASGVAVNTALLYVLIEVGGLNHLVAALLATEAAILSNFALNDRWTFRDSKPAASVVRRAFRYNLVALGGLAISVAVLAVLTYFADFHYLFANLFAIGAATLWNYAASRSWTWPTGPVPLLRQGVSMVEN